MRVAGVHIKAGHLFIAVLDSNEDGSTTTPALVAGERLEPNAGLDSVEQLADLSDRLRQFLAPHKVDRVALMETRQFGKWKYVDAFARVSKICALMNAVHVLAVPFSTVKTNHAARTLRLDASKLRQLESARLGLGGDPKYWTTGLSEAAAAAMSVAGSSADTAGPAGDQE